MKETGRRSAGWIVALLVALPPAAEPAEQSAHTMKHDPSAHAESGASPYAGLEARSIKALGEDEIEALESGEGMGFALAAELNGYPGPKHVLEMREELELSAEQAAQTRKAYDLMHAAAVELGRRIVEQERGLDRLFAAHTVEGDELDRLTAEIGRLRGELRAVHLRAHLRMVEILSPGQRHAYVTGRGYHHGGRRH